MKNDNDSDAGGVGNGNIRQDRASIALTTSVVLEIFFTHSRSDAAKIVAHHQTKAPRLILWKHIIPLGPFQVGF